jgi:hypothetical protein
MNPAMLPKGLAAGTAQDGLEQVSPSRPSATVRGATRHFIGRPYGHETKIGRRAGRPGFAIDRWKMGLRLRRGRKSEVIHAHRPFNEGWHPYKILNICSLFLLRDIISGSHTGIDQSG